MGDAEVVELAARLRSLERTWELEAPASARRSSAVARRQLVIWPRWELLDTAIARAGSRRTRDKETVERVRLRVTEYGTRWDQPLDAFVRMAAALRTSLGEPTDRRPGDGAAIHWAASADTTLVLERTTDAVYLELVTDKRLSLDEELLRMDEEGLL